MARKKPNLNQDIQVAIDTVIFAVRGGELNVLLIKMKKPPFVGRWALPGGLISDHETTLVAAERILSEETGVTGVYLEQLMTFDELKRDPAGRVVSVAWFALLPDGELELHTSEKYAGVEWRPISQAKNLAYDHNEILRVAVDRLRAKLGYTNVVWSLLPTKFSLTELQAVYEIILGRALDKRNFRKKILAAGLLKATGAQRVVGAHRPAALYAFKTKKLIVANIIS